jgi:GNAT superfamily N-acetyltransferase
VIISVRPASHADVTAIEQLYRAAEPEQTARKPIWALTDGYDEPVADQIREGIDAEESWTFVGEIDDVPVGFVWVTLEEMLTRAGGSRIGRMRLIYTEPDARGVGVGNAMLEHFLEVLRPLGVRHFDAPVGPGQRLTKNFFEGHGFAARSIIMHHTDPADAPDIGDGS